MLRASRKHLADVGETYFEHMRFAATVGLLAVGAGLACLLHALIPAVCQQTCSRTVALLQELFADRRRLPAVSDQSSGVVIFVVLTALSSLTAVVMVAWIGDLLIGALAIAQAYALPTIYLSQNPGLDPVR
jgi:Family of unknown function (DUF6356)